VVVTGDRTLLERLTANLIGNAVRHNAEDGTVWVATRSSATGGELTVANTGPMIDPAVARTLTEPFVRGAGRTRRDGAEGAGLGLAIVAAIVRAHRGALAVSARAEGGLAVRVTLPAQPAR
jgi:two-component system, OmpR family, sensor histidine kinase VanS